MVFLKLSFREGSLPAGRQAPLAEKLEID